MSVVQQLQQQNAQLQQQVQAMMGAAQEVLNAPAGQQGPAPKNMLPDGSQVGGREGNLMVNRMGA
jgi:hypothetical protein